MTSSRHVPYWLVVVARTQLLQQHERRGHRTGTVVGVEAATQAACPHRRLPL